MPEADDERGKSGFTEFWSSLPGGRDELGGEGCFGPYFEGVPADRLKPLEAGTRPST